MWPYEATGGPGYRGHVTSAADPPRDTRNVSVADELRRLIMTGEISPGTRLVQAELASRFGTSITPVRKALAVLSRRAHLQRAGGTGGNAAAVKSQ